MVSEWLIYYYCFINHQSFGLFWLGRQHPSFKTSSTHLLHTLCVIFIIYDDTRAYYQLRFPTYNYYYTKTNFKVLFVEEDKVG